MQQGFLVKFTDYYNIMRDQFDLKDTVKASIFSENKGQGKNKATKINEFQLILLENQSHNIR